MHQWQRHLQFNLQHQCMQNHIKDYIFIAASKTLPIMMIVLPFLGVNEKCLYLFKVLTFIWRCWNDLSDCCLNSLGRKGENFEDGTRQGGIIPSLFFLFLFYLPRILLLWHLERNGLHCTFNEARMVIIHECYMPFSHLIFYNYFVFFWIHR